MLKVVILMCAVGTDPSACNIHTAREVFHGPNTTSSAQCMMMSQQAAAASPLYASKDTFMKTLCLSEEATTQAASRDETAAAMRRP